MVIKELESFLMGQTDFYDIKIIGKSVLGRNIYSINKEFNKNYKWALITAGIHAREHLSCDLVCFFIQKLREEKSLPYNISFVPLINPDGVDFCINGAKGYKEDIKNKLIKINGGEDFTLYKANANGVDLNNNWDAKWENNFSKKEKPSSQGFYGYSPMSEPEVKALAKWSRSLDLFLTLSYHLKGEEIYFDFFQDKKAYKRDLKVAKVFAKSSGYHIRKMGKKSSGGFKDWCVQEFRIPSLTIELGRDKYSHPYPKSDFDNICKKNENLFKNIEKSLKIYKKCQL